MATVIKIDANAQALQTALAATLPELALLDNRNMQIAGHRMEIFYFVTGGTAETDIAIMTTLADVDGGFVQNLTTPSIQAVQVLPSQTVMSQAVLKGTIPAGQTCVAIVYGSASL